VSGLGGQPRGRQVRKMKNVSKSNGTERRVPRCTRCGKTGTIRSPQRNDCCRGCYGKSEGWALIQRELKMGHKIDIVADASTVNACGIDVFALPAGRRSAAVLLKEGQHGGTEEWIYGRMNGFSVRWHSPGDGHRGAQLAAMLDELPLDVEVVVLLYAGRRKVVHAVRRRLAAGAVIVIVAEGGDAEEWGAAAPGVLTIAPGELPQRRRREGGDAGAVVA